LWPCDGPGRGALHKGIGQARRARSPLSGTCFAPERRKRLQRKGLAQDLPAPAAPTRASRDACRYVRCRSRSARLPEPGSLANSLRPAPISPAMRGLTA
jgi:hypothetical protein